MKFGVDAEMIEEFFTFVDSENKDFLGDLFVLTVCTFACKGTITVDEQEFIEEHFL